MENLHTPSDVFDELIDNFDFKLFKTLSEPVRLDILKYLMLNGRSDVGTIAENLPQDRSVVSRHLNRMHEAGILNCEKETRHMYYEINGQGFIDKLEKFTGQVRKCMERCCPPCCK
ncbi:MAG: winged helix-turn-helix domain-containing protein [Desulfobacterales bacterium]|jgi:DNA-binding transcriptional ArsR family regulator